MTHPMNPLPAFERMDMTDKSQLRALLNECYRTDEAWSLELHKAFGKDAGDRRYDADKSSHPEACNRAHEAWKAAQADFDAAGGYRALFADIGASS